MHKQQDNRGPKPFFIVRWDYMESDSGPFYLKGNDGACRKMFELLTSDRKAALNNGLLYVEMVRYDEKIIFEWNGLIEMIQEEINTKTANTKTAIVCSDIEECGCPQCAMHDSI